MIYLARLDASSRGTDASARGCLARLSRDASQTGRDTHRAVSTRHTAAGCRGASLYGFREDFVSSYVVKKIADAGALPATAVPTPRYMPVLY